MEHLVDTARSGRSGTVIIRCLLTASSCGVIELCGSAKTKTKTKTLDSDDYVYRSITPTTPTSSCVYTLSAFSAHTRIKAICRRGYANGTACSTLFARFDYKIAFHGRKEYIAFNSAVVQKGWCGVRVHVHNVDISIARPRAG